MNRLVKLLAIIGGAILILTFNLAVVYIFPWPFSSFNAIFAAIFLSLLIYEFGSVVWLAFFSYLVIELYSVSTPFGILIFSATIATLLSLWLFRHIFTNRSWYAGIALTAIGVGIFRSLYLILIFLVRIIDPSQSFYWSKLFLTFAWEIIFTSLAVGLIFFILSRFFPQLRNLTVEKKRFFF